MPFRTAGTPINPKPGRSHEAKMMIAGAVGIHGKAPGRLRLKVISDYSARTLGAFVQANLVPDSTVIRDGWSGYVRLKDVKHEPKIVGPMLNAAIALRSAHVLLPWIHRVFGNAKRWAMGVYHGLRAPHLQRYLDEFIFRCNRRHRQPDCVGFVARGRSAGERAKLIHAQRLERTIDPAGSSRRDPGGEFGDPGAL